MANNTIAVLRQMLASLDDAKKYQSLRDVMSTLPAPDLAAVFEDLPPEKMPVLFRLCPKDLAAEIFAELDKPFVNGLTVLGGEPFEPRNQRDLLPLLREVREKYPQKDIWCFTGFRLEDELLRDGSYPRCEVTDDLLRCIDILVDGRFLREEKDISLQFRGSRNQRIIDLPRTLSSGRIVLWDQLRR